MGHFGFDRAGWHRIPGVWGGENEGLARACLPAWPPGLLCVFPRELWPSLSQAPGPRPAARSSPGISLRKQKGLCELGAKGGGVRLPGQPLAPRGESSFPLRALLHYPLLGRDHGPNLKLQGRAGQAHVDKAKRRQMILCRCVYDPGLLLRHSAKIVVIY